MATIRKLQYIGKQHLLNLPAYFVKYVGWQKGDYLAVVQKGNDALEIRKIAGGEAPRALVGLTALEQEAAALSVLINATGANIDGGTYAGYLARFTHVAAKARRLRRKMDGQSQQNMTVAA